MSSKIQTIEDIIKFDPGEDFDSEMCWKKCGECMPRGMLKWAVLWLKTAEKFQHHLWTDIQGSYFRLFKIV